MMEARKQVAILRSTQGRKIAKKIELIRVKLKHHGYDL